MNLWNRLLTGLWVVEDPAEGGPIRHGWLNFTSSWFYPTLFSLAILGIAVIILSHAATYSLLAYHALAYPAIFRFWYDRNPERQAAKRRARKARRKHGHIAQRS